MWGKLLRWVIGPILGIAALLAIVAGIGVTIDTAAERSEDHDRCMKHAHSGYGIDRCP